MELNVCATQPRALTAFEMLLWIASATFSLRRRLSLPSGIGNPRFPKAKVGHCSEHKVKFSLASVRTGRYARSDVDALGCVVFEMLVEEPPFREYTARSEIAKRLSESLNA